MRDFDTRFNASIENHWTIAASIGRSRHRPSSSHDVKLSSLDSCKGLFAILVLYISDRKHYVHYSDISSKLFKVTCGVPQGSVLGPLLFILYINDFSDCINMSSILFAEIQLHMYHIGTFRLSII